MNKEDKIEQLYNDWMTNPRWEGITRPYIPEDVIKLRGSVEIEYTLAKLGANKLWNKLINQSFVEIIRIVDDKN